MNSELVVAILDNVEPHLALALIADMLKKNLIDQKIVPALRVNSLNSRLNFWLYSNPKILMN